MRTTKTAVIAALAALAAGSAFADYAADCKAAANRKRNVMYYEVGYNPCFWPKGKPFSVASFRSTSCQNESLDGYAHTKVNIDSFVYVPIGGFGVSSCKIKSCANPVAQPNKTTRYLAGQVNMLPEFYKAGTDPLTEVCKWARENKKEIICAMPLNNLEHGSLSDKTQPGMWENYFISPWKKTHESSLIGGSQSEAAKGEKATKAPKKATMKYCDKDAVDYSKSDVRALFKQMCVEIVEKYDLDGLMLDFTKSPYFFSSVAFGEAASAKEAGDITTMITEIKAAVAAAGQKKNHPILLSARVPDSVSFCKEIGLDLAGWATAKLFDFYVACGEFELNPPEVFGEFAKSAGVPWYRSCGVSYIFTGNDSGYPDDDERPGLQRQDGPHTFRGRAMSAYHGGASGMMYWNPTRWHRFPMRSLAADPESFKFENKRYHVTYTYTGQRDRCVKDANKHCTIPQLLSGSPYDLGKGVAKYPIYVWDNLPALKKDGKHVPIVRLTTEVSLPSGTDLTVQLNNKALKLRKKRAGSQIFDVPYEVAKYGMNEVIVKATGKNKRGQTAKLGNIAIDVIFDQNDGEVAQ